MGRVKWLCKCSCGKEVVVGGTSLSIGTTQSCGCLASENLVARNKAFSGKNSPIYIEDRTWLIAKVSLRSYKGNAKLRNLIFDLTDEKAFEIMKEPCFYCGQIDTRYTRYRQEKAFLNGLDRVENIIGYTVDNVVPCCKMCNLSKKNASKEEFLSWVEKIYKYSIEKIPISVEIPHKFIVHD
jgi:hypothetical protein